MTVDEDAKKKIEQANTLVYGTHEQRITLIENSIDASNSVFYLLLGSLVWNMNKIMGFFFYLIFLIEFNINIKKNVYNPPTNSGRMNTPPETTESSKPHCSNNVSKIRIFALIAGLLIIIISMSLNSFSRIPSPSHGFRILMFIILFIFKNTILKKITAMITQLVINSICNPSNILCSIQERTNIKKNDAENLAIINSGSGLDKRLKIPVKTGGLFTGVLFGEFFMIISFILCYIILNRRISVKTDQLKYIYKLLAYLKSELGWFDYNTLYFDIKYFKFVRQNLVEVLYKFIIFILYSNIVPVYYNNYIETTNPAKTNKIFTIWNKESWQSESIINYIATISPVFILLSNNYEYPGVPDLPDLCTRFPYTYYIWQFLKKKNGSWGLQFISYFFKGLLTIIPLFGTSMSEGITLLTCNFMRIAHIVLEKLFEIKLKTSIFFSHIFNLVLFIFLYFIIRHILIAKTCFRDTYTCIPVSKEKTDDETNNNQIEPTISYNNSTKSVEIVSYSLFGIILLLTLFNIITIPPTVKKIIFTTIFTGFTMLSAFLIVESNTQQFLLKKLQIDNHDVFFTICKITLGILSICCSWLFLKTRKMSIKIMILLAIIVSIVLILWMHFSIKDRDKQQDVINKFKSKKIMFGIICGLLAIFGIIFGIVGIKSNKSKAVKILCGSISVLCLGMSGYLGWRIYNAEDDEFETTDTTNKLIVISIIFGLITFTLLGITISSFRKKTSDTLDSVLHTQDISENDFKEIKEIMESIKEIDGLEHNKDIKDIMDAVKKVDSIKDKKYDDINETIQKIKNIKDIKKIKDPTDLEILKTLKKFKDNKMSTDDVQIDKILKQTFNKTYYKEDVFKQLVHDLEKIRIKTLMLQRNNKIPTEIKDLIKTKYSIVAKYLKPICIDTFNKPKKFRYCANIINGNILTKYYNELKEISKQVKKLSTGTTVTDKDNILIHNLKTNIEKIDTTMRIIKKLVDNFGKTITPLPVKIKNSSPISRPDSLGSNIGSGNLSDRQEDANETLRQMSASKKSN